MAPASAGRSSLDVLKLLLVLLTFLAAPSRATAAPSARHVGDAGRSACNAGALRPEGGGSSAGLAMLQRAQTRLEAAAAPAPGGLSWEAASEYDDYIDDAAAELLFADAAGARSSAGAIGTSSTSTTTATTTVAQASMGDVGETAELNSQGYQLVVNSRSVVQMSAFFERMVKRLGDEVGDRAGLHGYAYNATVQGYPCFASVLESIAWAPWVKWGNPEDATRLASFGMKPHDKAESLPQNHQKNNEEPAGKPVKEVEISVESERVRKESLGGTPGRSSPSAGGQSTEAKKSAESIPLNENGYSDIAEMRSHEAMQTFVRRVVADLGYDIVDEGGLNGFVGYYDGEFATQSLKRMRDEIKHAPWVNADVKGA